MFNFDTYTKSSTTQCSPNVSGSHYEQMLIEVLSLPVQCSTRNLEMPFSSQLQSFGFENSGEPFLNACSGAPSNYVCENKTLNDLNTKLNIINSSNTSEDTHHDSNTGSADPSTPTEEKLSSENSLEIQSTLKISSIKTQDQNISPSVPLPQDCQIYENATVVDMSEEDKVKKGLSSLSFKLLKVLNPETQRKKTKFLCTYKS